MRRWWRGRRRRGSDTTRGGLARWRIHHGIARHGWLTRLLCRRRRVQHRIPARVLRRCCAAGLRRWRRRRHESQCTRDRRRCERRSARYTLWRGHRRWRRAGRRRRQNRAVEPAPDEPMTGGGGALCPDCGLGTSSIAYVDPPVFCSTAAWPACEAGSGGGGGAPCAVGRAAARPAIEFSAPPGCCGCGGGGGGGCVAAAAPMRE